MKRLHMASYGLLALPLAFAGLPLYVFIPKFYADYIGLSLTSIGSVLILCRLFDALQDPLFGYLSGRYIKTTAAQRKVVAVAMLAMVGAFSLLLQPPAASGLWWFSLTLFATVSAYSLVTINYYALAAEQTRDYYEQSLLCSWREGFGLGGVLLASILPTLLMMKMPEIEANYYVMIILAAFTLLALLFLFRGLPLVHTPSAPAEILTPSVMWRAISGNRAFKRLALIFLVNGIGVSIPATILLFYVQDVIGAKHYTGLFLVCYFLTGAAAMPFWNRMIRRFGKKHSWLASMAVSVVAFVWAFMLGSGDIAGFTVICLLSGLAFGADMAIPPSMLADCIDKNASSTHYFGVWAFIAKCSLAIASFLAFALMEAGGYDNSAAIHDADSIFILACVYGLLPCAFKLLAMALLWKSPLDIRKPI